MKCGGSVVALHHLFHMVLSGIGNGRKVGIGVVHLIVEDILQRCDLREVVAQVVHQALPTRIILGDDHNNHPLTGAGVANNEIAQAAGVVANVVERQFVGNGIIAHSETDLVAEIVLKCTMLNIEHFVEKGGDMESQSTGLRWSVGAGDDIMPGFGGESVF